MKVADITCDSDISQFLNLSELEGLLSDINSGEVDKLKEKVVDPISKEIKAGGLDEYSVNIGGNPIYNEKAVVLVRSLEASFSDLNRVYLGIISAGKSHLTEEINTYISKLNEKISSLNQDISYYSQKINFANRSGLDKTNKEKYESAKESLVNEREKYVKKLEGAKVLLEQTANWSSSSQAQSVSVSESGGSQTTSEKNTSKTGLIEPGYDLLKTFEP